MFNSILPITYYKEVATIDEQHKVYVVQHIETKKIYIKKVLSVYNLDIYSLIFNNPVRNIPRIYAMYEDSQNKTLTIIEEYISGETLLEILEICGTLKELDVAKYTIQLCDILNNLHSFNPSVVHRDIKPSNIMVTEDSRVILIDLNAAHLNNPNKAQDTKLLGTEEFAAPEQFGFGNSSPRTDIYSIGLLMATLLTGKPDANAVPPCKLKKIINKCTKLGPKERFKSTVHLKKVLKKTFSL